jgi:hypothetical protein
MPRRRRSAANDYLAQQWSAKSASGLAHYLHAWQDQYATGHNFSVWNGSLPKGHVVGDLYPDPAMAQRIIGESAQLIRGYKSACPSCFPNSR